MGRHHARVYAQSDEAELVGVVDSDPEPRERVAGEWGGCAYASVDELIGAGVDAVSIATPTRAHRAAAEGLLKAGIACLIEKPLAPDAESARAIARTAEQAGAPYAEAIIRREADINQCPPGGTKTIKALAELLDRQVKPLNQAHGLEKELHLALIDEALCIGCAKCIKACPVDAILGAAKQMHTVLAGECTGCELCIAPCPMDCISMQPVIA